MVEAVTNTAGWLAAIAGATSDIRRAIFDRGGDLPPNSGLKHFAPALRGLGSTPAPLPPADWPDLSVGMPDNALRGLVKIETSATENHVAFSITCPEGSYTVAWGDGTSNTYVSGAVAEHSWVWADGAPCSEGYRVAVVEVTATATITGLDLIYLPTAWATDRQGYWSVWLDLYANLPNLTNLRIGQDRGVIIHQWLRRFGGDFGTIQSNATNMFYFCASLTRLPDVLDLSNVTNATSMFQYCPSLTRLPDVLNLSNVTNASSMFAYCPSLTRLPDVLNLSNVTNASSMFAYCTSLTRLPDVLDLSNVTNATYMFYFCTSLTRLPDVLDLSNVTNATNMFQYCPSLTRLPDVLDLSNVTNATYMFYFCASLTRLPDVLNLSNVTNASSMFAYCTSLTRLPDVLNLSNVTNATNMFQYCQSLTRLPSTGLKVATSIQNSATGRVALNDFFTGLGTASGAQVVNITSCPGRLTCDRTIATAKGWTVTG